MLNREFHHEKSHIQRTQATNSRLAFQIKIPQRLYKNFFQGFRNSISKSLSKNLSLPLWRKLMAKNRRELDSR